MLPCRYFCRYFRYLLKYFFLKCGDKLEQAEVTLKEIYEKVSLKVPLEQRRFFNFFNDAVAELEALYPDLLFKEGVHFTPVHDLSDENVVLPLYTPAIVDNILYFAVTTNKVYSNKNLHENQEMPMCIIGKITHITDVYDE